MIFDSFQIKAFIREMLGDHPQWAKQVLEKGKTDIEFHKCKWEFKESDLWTHFDQKPVTNGRWGKYGSLAFCGKFADDQAKWFCIDADKQDHVDKLNIHIIPKLDELDIEHIYGHSGKSEDRCHLWIKARAHISLLEAFVEWLFKSVGLNSREMEVYPLWNKQNNVIRFEGGIHLRHDKAFPITYKDQTSAEAAFVLQSFIDLKAIDEDFIRQHVTYEEEVKPKKTYTGPFTYLPRNLKLPAGYYPGLIKTVGTNCQAINKALTDSVERRMLEETGFDIHMVGRYLTNLAIIHDHRRSKKAGKEIEEGRNWAEEFLSKNRGRSWESHHWLELSRYENPDRLFPNCQTWERDLDSCRGCPFYGRIHSPRELFDGKQLKRTFESNVRLVSHEQVREETFPKVRQRILDLAASGEKSTILIASPLGSGKSFFTDNLAAELVKLGKKVLIAVPSGDIAIEHSKRLTAAGVALGIDIKPFMVMSHKNLFYKFRPGFNCPKYQEIQHEIQLGISTNTLKKRFCEGCKHKQECPFPEQYVNVVDKNLVIVQHAHFTSGQAMTTILTGKFDFLFIDEEFINSLITKLKPKEMELEVLRKFQDKIRWIDPLLKWMEKGGQGNAVISAGVKDLELLKYEIEETGLEWRIPEFLREFTNGAYMQPGIGTHVFHPVPNIPVRVFTDATPPIDMLKMVLDRDYIETFGADEVFDYRTKNPNNQVIQVLDSSMSKSALRGQKDDEGNYEYERLVRILSFIAGKALTDYSKKKILITTYKDFKSICESWLRLNYPEIMDRVLISHMAVGTNAFEEFEVQFLVAGVYFNAKQYYDEVYLLKIIRNFWNLAKDRALVPNFYQFGVGDEAFVESKPEEIRRIEPDTPSAGVVSGAAVYKYKDVTRKIPVDFYHNLTEKLAISKTQQAIRLRFNDSIEKIVYVFGNYFLPSFLITRTELEEDLLNSTES